MTLFCTPLIGESIRPGALSLSHTHGRFVTFRLSSDDLGSTDWVMAIGTGPLRRYPNVLVDSVIRDGVNEAVSGQASIEQKVNNMCAFLLAQTEYLRTDLAVPTDVHLHAKLHIHIPQHPLVVQLYSL